MGLEPLILNLKKKVSVDPATVLRDCSRSMPAAVPTHVLAVLLLMDLYDAQIRRVDNEILTAVRQQSDSGARARCASHRREQSPLYTMAMTALFMFSALVLTLAKEIKSAASGAGHTRHCCCLLAKSEACQSKSAWTCPSLPSRLSQRPCYCTQGRSAKSNPWSGNPLRYAMHEMPDLWPALPS